MTQTLTSNLRQGDANLVLLSLQKAGVTVKQYVAIGKDPDVNASVVQILQHNRSPRTVVRNRSRLPPPQTPSLLFTPDMIPKGWKVVEDGTPIVKFRVKDLEIWTRAEDKQEWVEGKEKRQRALGLGLELGLVEGVYLIDHQKEILVGWRQFYIALPKTTLRNPDGGLRYPYLYWECNRWSILFGRTSP